MGGLTPELSKKTRFGGEQFVVRSRTAVKKFIESALGSSVSSCEEYNPREKSEMPISFLDWLFGQKERHSQAKPLTFSCPTLMSLIGETGNLSLPSNPEWRGHDKD